jgi:hypothetical protein
MIFAAAAFVTEPERARAIPNHVSESKSNRKQEKTKSNLDNGGARF